MWQFEGLFAGKIPAKKRQEGRFHTHEVEQAEVQGEHTQTGKPAYQREL